MPCIGYILWNICPYLGIEWKKKEDDPMGKVFRAWFSGRGRSTDGREELLESMKATRCALSRAYDGFNRTGDPDLIESYVYEINALQHRYSYLLRQVRGLEEQTPSAV